MRNNESTPPSGKLLTSFIQNRTFQAGFLIYSSVLIFLGRQLDLGLQNFDDAWYAQKAKEIFLSGNPFIVTYNGVPEFAEPPLYFWLSGLSFKIFGVSGYGAVFPSAVLGAATIYLTYRLGLALFNNQWTAFLAAIVLLFPGMFTDSARRGMVDISLAFFVTSAMFSFYKAQEDKRFYLLFGLMTALGVLTKSMLGFFPLIIAGVLLIVYGRVKEFWNGYFLAGAVVALGFGSSWYWINYLKFGDEFIHIHFGVHLLKRGFTLFTDPLYFLGYCKDLLKTYWPWLPFFLWGLVLFGREAFQERDFNAGFVLAWFAVIFLTMSASKNQTLRYLFMMFPAMALVTSKTIADLLTEKWRQRLLPYLMASVLATILMINALPVKVDVSLSQNSEEVRRLAPVIQLNASREKISKYQKEASGQNGWVFPCYVAWPGLPEPRGGCDSDLGNFRLSPRNPEFAVIFYSGRHLSNPLTETSELLERLDKYPESTWLTSRKEYQKLVQDHSGLLYLIESTSKYVYFTSIKNRENIRYDLSEWSAPVIR